MVLLEMFQTRGNIIRSGSGLLSQWVTHVSLLLPALVYFLSYLTGQRSNQLSHTGQGSATFFKVKQAKFQFTY